MFLGANWLLRRLRGKCREKGNVAALRLFISQRFLKTPVLSLSAPRPPTPHCYSLPSSFTTSTPGCLVAVILGPGLGDSLSSCEPNSKMGTLQTHFCSRGKSEHKCPPKCVWMLATSLCRSLQRGTSYSPKAIGLYNLLCTRLWLWKKEGFFFFFWVLLARLLKCEQSWTEQTSCRGKDNWSLFCVCDRIPLPRNLIFFKKIF